MHVHVWPDCESLAHCSVLDFQHVRVPSFSSIRACTDDIDMDACTCTYMYIYHVLAWWNTHPSYWAGSLQSVFSNFHIWLCTHTMRTLPVICCNRKYVSLNCDLILTSSFFCPAEHYFSSTASDSGEVQKGSDTESQGWDREKTNKFETKNTS